MVKIETLFSWEMCPFATETYMIYEKSISSIGGYIYIYRGNSKYVKVLSTMVVYVIFK